MTKPISRIQALDIATLDAGPVLNDGNTWVYSIGARGSRFPTYHQARDDRAQSIAENAARRYLESRGLPDKLTIPGNIKGNVAARFRILLDALPESIRTKL